MTSPYILANETAPMRARRLELGQQLSAYRRYQQTPEYRAAEIEKGRLRERHRREWLAFAAAGWPVSESLVRALVREEVA